MFYVEKIRRFIAALAALLLLCSAAGAADIVEYTVASGDSLWKIAVKYQVGLDELILANPQIKTPA